MESSFKLISNNLPLNFKTQLPQNKWLQLANTWGNIPSLLKLILHEAQVPSSLEVDCID